MPDWLEDARLPDEEFAQAYDATPAPLRAAIKTGLALAWFHYRPCPDHEKEQVCDADAGFCRQLQAAPVSWTLLALGSGVRAAARVAAAAVLPVLAGVRQIFAICAPDPHQTILTSLDLTGICDLFCLAAGQPSELIASLAGTPGRIMLLGHWPEVAESAAQAGIPFHEEKSEPALLLADPDAFEPDILRFCQGIVPPTCQKDPDCVYALASNARCPQSFLRLAPGCEGFWLFRNLTPAFFRARAHRFNLYEGEG